MRLTLRPDRLVAGGDAMARDDDGRVVFVRGALPGEEVDVEIRTEKKDFARGELVEIVQPSSARREPQCHHRRTGCGGCGWMHVEPSAQHDAKVDIVAESLRRIGRLDGDVVDRIVVRGGAVSPFRYRTTLRVVGLEGGGVGFREQGSDVVVPVNSCDVATRGLSDVLDDLSVAPGVEATIRESLATGAMTARWSMPKRKRPSGSRRPVEGLPDHTHIGDRAWLTERVDGVDLRVSAASFFQSGVQAAELLVDAVARAAPELRKASSAVDAYGGVGLFAATVMADVDRVVVLESARSSWFDARHNLEDRDAEVVKIEVGRWSPGERPFDVVVADPARPGLGRPGAQAVVAAGAPVVVLVSCDPVSLARDSALLAEQGYRPERVEVLDVFPQTPHVETVTRFVRA